MLNHISLVLLFLFSLFYLLHEVVRLVYALIVDVEPQYTGAKIEGDVVTLDFVKKMIDDFKNQKSLHKR